MKLGLIASALLLAGCGGLGSVDKPAYSAGDYLAAGVLRTLDDPATKLEISGLVDGAVSSARDAVLNDKTELWFLELERVLLLEVRRQLLLAVAESRAEALRGLDAEVQKLVEGAVAGVSSRRSLSSLDAVREQLLGEGLRKDARVMLTDLDPVLQDMIKRASAGAVLSVSSPIEKDIAVIDQSLEKWKWIAITLAVAVAILVFMHAHAVHAMSKRGD